MEGPNSLVAAVSIVKSIIRTAAPRPAGSGAVEVVSFTAVLSDVAAKGPGSLVDHHGELRDVIDALAAVDPDRFGRLGALAYWIDLYNAGALELAARTAVAGEETVLRVPGAFGRPFVTVNGEDLSLDAIEHGKVRRFGDPRVHAALVCGSVSCPTLRSSPYSGTDLDAVLDDQMAAFLAGGGAVADRTRGVLRLSKVFSWFGGDMVQPGAMPWIVPARRSSLVDSLKPHLDVETRRWIDSTSPAVEFQGYDWGLRCSVG
jgi:hypothetical protein